MNEIVEYIQDKVTDITKQTAKETDRLILEYMQKRNLTIDDLKGNVAMQREESNDPWEQGVTVKTTYWYKGDLMITVTQKIDVTKPLETKAEMIIEKGDW